jgi:alkane 1-monooxygenase
MRSWRVKTAGFMLAPMVPLACLALVHVGYEWLLPFIFFVLLPLARPYLGRDTVQATDMPLHSRWYTGMMEVLPAVSVVTLAVCLLGISLLLPELSWPRFASVLLAYFTTAALVIPAMHELLHGRRLWQWISARVVAGLLGYPHFPEDHLAHHRAIPSAAGDPDPPAGRNVFGHAAAAARQSLRHALPWALKTPNAAVWIAFALAVTVCVAGAIFYLAGAAGLLFYLTAVLLIWFAVQAVNYVQHYGLPPDHEATDLPIAWDDDCWVQACLTFNICYHEAHHLQMSRPYFLLQAPPSRAPLPGSYGIMFLLCLAPPAFNHVMRPRLAAVLAGVAPSAKTRTSRLPRCLD